MLHKHIFIDALRGETFYYLDKRFIEARHYRAGGNLLGTPRCIYEVPTFVGMTILRLRRSVRLRFTFECIKAKNPHQ